MNFPCKNCGKDIGWDAPSGVCSMACLRAAQGYGPEPDPLPHDECDPHCTCNDCIDSIMKMFARNPKGGGS